MLRARSLAPCCLVATVGCAASGEAQAPPSTGEQALPGRAEAQPPGAESSDRAPDDREDDDEAPAPDAPAGADAKSPEALSWRPLHFAEAGIDLEIIDAPHETRAWERGGVFAQRIPIGEGEALRVLIRAGDGESLDALRRERAGDGVKTSRIHRGTTCGLPSQHLEIRAPAIEIECIKYADGRPSEPGTIPAMTTVAAAFRHRGLDVVVTWELPTALRERHAEAERRFFAGLRCEQR